MPEQFLHGADIVARFELMGRKGVTQRVRCGRLREPGIAYGLLESALNSFLVDVMAPARARTGING